MMGTSVTSKPRVHLRVKTYYIYDYIYIIAKHGKLMQLIIFHHHVFLKLLIAKFVKTLTTTEKV